MRPPTLHAIAWACAIAWALPAAAVAGDDTEAKQSAQAHFARGQRLFDAGEFVRAAEEFELAYEAAPHQAVLANIALSYDRAGNAPAAVESYRRYLADPVAGQKNALFRERLRELEAQVGELDIRCATDQCMISVDGSDRGLAPVTVVVHPGAHQVDASAGGRPLDSRSVSVRPGAVARVTIAPPARDGAQGEPAPPPPQQSDAPDEGAALGPAFWIASGVTVAAGAATVVFGVRTLRAKDDYEASGWTDPEAKERGEQSRLITNVMIGITAAAGATATALAIHGLVSADEEPPIALGPGPGIGLAAQGRF